MPVVDRIGLCWAIALGLVVVAIFAAPSCNMTSCPPSDFQLGGALEWWLIGTAIVWAPLRMLDFIAGGPRRRRTPMLY